MTLKTPRVALSVVLTSLFTLLALHHAYAQPNLPSKLSQLPRDPNQRVIIVSDLDESLVKNVGYYIVRRVPVPGIPGVKISGLPQEIKVPSHDFEGNTGPRIKDLLATSKNFVQSAALQTITLSNGEKIIPGYYYFDRDAGYTAYRPNGAPENGHFYQSVIERIKTKTPFLLEGAPLIAPAFAEEYADQVVGYTLSMRGQQNLEGKLVMETLRDTFGWGTRPWSEKGSVFLTHEDYSQYNEQKNNFLRNLYQDLHRKNIAPGTRPHVLLMIENGQNWLKDIDHLFENIATNGFGANPVIPILVNLIEPEVLNNPRPKGWSESALSTHKKMYRTTIYTPDTKEQTNSIPRALEVALGLSKEEAFKKFKNWASNCNGLLSIQDAELRKSLGDQP